jgi:hypothetical protein
MDDVPTPPGLSTANSVLWLLRATGGKPCTCARLTRVVQRASCRSSAASQRQDPGAPLDQLLGVVPRLVPSAVMDGVRRRAVVAGVVAVLEPDRERCRAAFEVRSAAVGPFASEGLLVALDLSVALGGRGDQSRPPPRPSPGLADSVMDRVADPGWLVVRGQETILRPPTAAAIGLAGVLPSSEYWAVGRAHASPGRGPTTREPLAPGTTTRALDAANRAATYLSCIRAETSESP